jgi:hypothetical protein
VNFGILISLFLDDGVQLARIDQESGTGEPEVARLMMRDLVNATIGFEELAATLGKNPESIHSMLAERGNPTKIGTLAYS